MATKIDPNFSDAWSALAILYADEYQLGYVDSGIQNIVDLAYEMAQKALKTGPDNALAYYALLYVSVVKNDVPSMRKAGAQALQLNPHNALILAEYGSHLAYTGDWQKGLELVEHAMTVNPFHPDFYHIPFVAYYLHEGRYEAALAEIKQVDMPEFFWIPLLTAAIYGWLGDTTAAKEQTDSLVNMYPNIAENARSELNKWNLLVTTILTGLSKGGFEVKH